MHCQAVLCPGRGTPEEGTPGSPVPGTPTQLAKLSAHAGCHVKGGRWSTPALPALPVVPQGLEGSLSRLDRAEAACEAPLSTPAQVTGAAGAAWSHRHTMSLLFLPCLVQPLCWHCPRAWLAPAEPGGTAASGWEQRHDVCPYYRGTRTMAAAPGLGTGTGARAAKQSEMVLLRHPAEKDAYENNYFGNYFPLSCLKPLLIS